MRRSAMLLCLLAACSTRAQSTGPASPPRSASAPVLANAADEDVTRYDRGGECQPARGIIQVDFPRGYSLIELATWYMDVTCKMIVVPRPVLERRTARAVSERIDAASAEEFFDTLLDHLRLSSTRSEQLTVITPHERRVEEGPALGLMPEPVPGRLPEPGNTADSAAEQPRDDSAKLTREFDDGITRIDETHHVIRKDLAERYYASPRRYGRGVRIVPAVTNGKADGFKLYALRPNSIYGRLGFRNGDHVHAVNGAPVTTPDKALEVYQKLPQASRIEVAITRRGKSLVLVIEFDDTE